MLHRHKLAQQRASQLGYPSDILARLQARQLEYARRLLRAKLKRKRQLQGTSAYPGLIKHYGVHPMGFRYFVGYQRPQSKYLPSSKPQEDNYFPQRQQPVPSQDYGPPSNVNFQPIDTPSVQPPERPQGPIHSVQTPIIPANPNLDNGFSDPPRPIITQPNGDDTHVHIQPVQPTQTSIQSQQPTVILQPTQPRPPAPQSPPYIIYPINQTPIHYHPIQQPHYHPVQQHYHPVAQAPIRPVELHPAQQTPIQFPQQAHLHPIPQTPIQLQPVQPLPQAPVAYPSIEQIPLQYYPHLQGSAHLHPIYQQYLRTLLQPVAPQAQAPVVRVPSVTLNAVNPVLRNVIQPGIPIGSSFQVGSNFGPAFRPSAPAPVQPIQPVFQTSSHPSSSFETSYSATFPRVPYPQAFPGVNPYPVSGPGTLIQGSPPGTIIESHGIHQGTFVQQQGPPPGTLLRGPPPGTIIESHGIHPGTFVQQGPPPGTLIQGPPPGTIIESHGIHPGTFIQNQGQPYLPDNQGPLNLVPHSHTLVSFRTGQSGEDQNEGPVQVPNGHIPSSIHPPAISLEPPFKRSDDSEENEYESGESQN